MADDGGAAAVRRSRPALVEGGGGMGLVDWRGSTPERVARIQRARLHAATAEACAELGATNVTVADVVRFAGVSRRTFYELFENYEDCLLSTVRDGVGQATLRVAAAVDREAKWRVRMRDGLASLLVFFEEDPVLGRLLVLEWQGAGRRALQLREEVLDALVRLVDEGRSEPGSHPEAAELAAEGVVGAVLSVVQGRMIRDKTKDLGQLTNGLMNLIVLPYLGHSAARRELDRPAPALTSRVTVPAGNPLRHSEMRLTYRTVRVLAAIAANPEASNRVIGDASGISDQGQVSKILARLRRLQLIENGDYAAIPGQPNAWTLTERGRQVTHTVANNAERPASTTS